MLERVQPQIIQVADRRFAREVLEFFDDLARECFGPAHFDSPIQAVRLFRSGASRSREL